MGSDKDEALKKLEVWGSSRTPFRLGDVCDDAELVDGLPWLPSRDLLYKMLHPDPATRPSAKKVVGEAKSVARWHATTVAARAKADEVADKKAKVLLVEEEKED